MTTTLPRKPLQSVDTLAPTGTVSVVIPTRNEADNILPLVRGVIGSMNGQLEEIIFVDDSTDSTPDAIAAVSARSNADIVLIHRPPKDRTGGLSGAVVAGMRVARGDWVCVMDGDLQHPPELIPVMLAEAATADLDMVIGGRFAPGTKTDMSTARRALSRTLIGAVQRAFVPLRSLRDPLTGFFVFRRNAIDVGALQPLGFKILVEIIARNSHLNVGEVGFDFGHRHAGESKASPRVMWDFMRHVFRLRRAVGNGRLIHYNIHNIITVTSPVRLPELKRFKVPNLSERASITVTVGSKLRDGDEEFAYRELGGVGFGMKMRRRPKIEIAVSTLVAASPHVLYTNIVEPVLRWEFVRRGYALVHAACVADDGNAFLITARTDTGKTTTMLKLLDRGNLGFISDDLILVDPTGVVLTYPKPLTISSHTVAAVRQAQLSRFERAALKIQSRLHSRSGRRFAFTLTKSRLPVATINACAQLVIPPPKYDVTRLVPGVEMVEKARLAGMYVIQRGEPGRREVARDEGLEILFTNCEDAFGFPPYANIVSYLQGEQAEELRRKEREIISRALIGTSTTVLSSNNLDWAETIAADLEGMLTIAIDAEPDAVGE